MARLPNSHDIRALRDRKREERQLAQAQIPADQRDSAYTSPLQLPPHQRRLHHQIARATRAAREQPRLPRTVTDEQRRWPGLVNPTEQEQ